MTHTVTHELAHAVVPATAAAAQEGERLPIPTGVLTTVVILAILAVWCAAGYLGYIVTRPVPLFSY